MQWIFTICSCLGFFLKFAKCHPTVHTFLTKPVEWDKSQPQLVYPQLHSADSLRMTSSSPASSPVLVLRTSAETFYIELTPNEHLLKSNVSIPSKTKSCHYQGKVLSHTGGTAAISICESNSGMIGTIMVRNEVFILRPLDHLEDAEKFQHLRNSSQLEGDPHLINRVNHPLPTYCGMNHDAIGTQYEENEIDGNHRSRRSTDDHKVIETAVYVDHPLYQKFIVERRRTEQELRDAVLAIINQVQIIYNYQSLKIKFKIVVVKLEFLTEEKDSPDPAEGDIDDYLDNFCSWQSKLNPPEPSLHHWDHAIMLSGYDLHKMTDGKKNGKVLGLAWVNGMCRPKHSCTLNEGSSFEAAFVIAHEMGHSLGMMHDGRGNDCDPSAHLMAEKTGPGRITWSSCSNDYLQKFFQNGRGKCLQDDDTNHVETTGRYKLDDQLPGHRFDLQDQCQLSLGLEYRPHVIPKIPFNNVCRELWCVSGLWASVAHPALEGSSCGVGKQCIQGKCKNRQPSAMEHECAPTTAFPYVQQMVADFMDKLKLAFAFMLP